jgi:hypothetical protein
MRQEQTLVIRANHYIKPDTVITVKSPKFLQWRAIDYTEEKPRLEEYLVQFKDEDKALEFRETFEKAKDFAKIAEELGGPILGLADHMISGSSGQSTGNGI